MSNSAIAITCKVRPKFFKHGNMLIRSVRFAWKASVNSVRSVHSSQIHFAPRNFRTANEVQDDLDTIAEVESNLFEASSKKSVEAGLNSTHYLAREPTPVNAPRVKKPLVKERITSPTKEDPDLKLTYKKLSLNDPLLSKLMLTAKSKKARDKKEQIVVEGRRLILDAIAAGIHVETVLFARKPHLLEIRDSIKQCKDAQIIRVPQQDLRSWSTLVSCPGVIAICRKPSVKEIDIEAEKRKSFPITVICDNIREPNNLGSIIRTCAAVPCQEILVTKGCCDPWDTKALRGGCGAQFNIAVYDDLTWDEVEKRLTPSNEEFSPHLFIAENNISTCKDFGLKIIDYDKTQFSNQIGKCALVIGGETHGVSEDAYRLFLACKNNNAEYPGGCLHIPMSPYVESLNTASAITLILFEIRKKMIMSCTDPSADQ